MVIAAAIRKHMVITEKLMERKLYAGERLF